MYDLSSELNELEIKISKDRFPSYSLKQKSTYYREKRRHYNLQQKRNEESQKQKAVSQKKENHWNSSLIKWISLKDKGNKNIRLVDKLGAT